VMHSTPDNARSVLNVSDLCVTFDTPDGPVAAVDGLTFDLMRGKTLGIVGESGSGKSQSVLAMLGLLPAYARVGGSVCFEGRNLLRLPQAQLAEVRGRRMAMIFQDPMTALNPYLTVARQMTEVLAHHRGMAHGEARRASLAALDRVQIPDAARRIDLYPHEFSGGMRQRVMIAMALLCGPDVLIADEPTTALDVTVQAQILALLRSLQKDDAMAMILITHDLGVVAESCDDVIVMYAGRMMERAGVYGLFDGPSHPYTRGLLGAVPRLDLAEGALHSIPGVPPDMRRVAPGCPFAPRCGQAGDRCLTHVPAFEAQPDGAARACHVATADLVRWAA